MGTVEESAGHGLEQARWLGALAAPAEDLNLIPSTYVMTQNHQAHPRGPALF